MDKCKVCGQHYKQVNKSHVKAKHGLSWNEYLAYDLVVLVENDKEVISIWDSVNTESIEFKMRYRKMRYNLVSIRDRECVDLRQGKYCFGCLKPIDELAVYIILSSQNETRYKRPEVMKKPHHLNCAVARAAKHSLIGLVMHPIEQNLEN